MKITCRLHTKIHGKVWLTNCTPHLYHKVLPFPTYVFLPAQANSSGATSLVPGQQASEGDVVRERMRETLIN